jgi:hypothetical protein
VSFSGADVTVDFRAVQALAVGMVHEAGMVVGELLTPFDKEEDGELFGELDEDVA